MIAPKPLVRLARLFLVGSWLVGSWLGLPSIGGSLASAQMSGTDLAAPVPRPPSGSTAPADVVESGGADGASESTGDAPSDTAGEGTTEGATGGTTEATTEATTDAPGDGTEASPDASAPVDPATDPATVPVALVIDAAAYGVDPVVGQHVSQRMRLTAEEMGYVVVSPEATIAAAQRMRMPYPPGPADLWRVTYVARARRGAFARVWAHQGRYVFEISVASLDGTGPFFARGTSGADDLHQVVAELTRQAMPPTDRWDAEGYQRYATAPAARPAPTTPPTPTVTPMVPGSRLVVERRRRDNRPGRRFDLALQTEIGIGVDDQFVNALVGGRFGVRITKTIAVGVTLQYANLRGRGERVSNILPMILVENRVRISRRLDLTVPLRFAIGYLPFNGPVVRFSAGLNLPVSSRVELQLDVLAPTFWILPNEQTAVSLNPALELIVRL
ncbi:MAG: hypothetical protein MUE69_04460 [Myxococcota bacterium]|nr:hypothetical protein [Myxococcota bacterium]